MLKSKNQRVSKLGEKGWFSEDRLAYISILFTLGMGAVTAYALTRVDYLSNDTDTLIWLVVIDARHCFWKRPADCCSVAP